MEVIMRRKTLLYIEVANSIKKDILEGKYEVGEYIPTENELEQIFDVSKITVRNAIDILVNEGYLAKKSGKGTTVLSNRLFNKLSKARSFSSILEEDHKLDKQYVSFKEIDVSSNEELHETFGNKAYCLERVYFLDDHPYIYFQHYLPIGEENGIEDIEKQSLYKWLAMNGYEVEHFRDMFSVATVGIAIQNLLEVKSDTLLCRKRYSYDHKGNIIELSYGYYDSHKYPYVIDYEI